MMKFINAIVVLFLLTGCVYYDYSGSFELSKHSETLKKRKASLSEIRDIEKVVFNVAKKFGFTVVVEQWMRVDIHFFMRKQKSEITLDSLDGSNSNMAIFLIKDPSHLSMTVRDLDHDYETIYMAKLKKELMERLNDVIDTKSVSFERLYTQD